MTYLVDTNVLVRSIQLSHPMHKDAGRATESLIDQGHQLSAIAQNLIEFWAVATRPLANNGLALSITVAAGHMADGKVTTIEEYSEIRGNVALDPRLFDPQYFATVHWKE